MVDRSYVIRHISYSQEACVRQMRGQLLGRKCYEVLWNSEKPCSRCTLNKEDPLDVSIIVSHFQQGTTAKIQGTVSESLLPLSNHQNPLFIVLVEPILPLPANRDTAAENSGSIHQTKLRDWISAEDQETTGKEKESPELEALKGALNPSALEDFAGGFRERAYLLQPSLLPPFFQLRTNPYRTGGSPVCFKWSFIKTDSRTLVYIKEVGGF